MAGTGPVRPVVAAAANSGSKQLEIRQIYQFRRPDNAVNGGTSQHAENRHFRHPESEILEMRVSSLTLVADIFI